MTFNNLAIEQASAKEANSYETCFVYENMDENKVNLEEIARELFADPLCTTLNKKVGKRKNQVLQKRRVKKSGHSPV